MYLLHSPCVFYDLVMAAHHFTMKNHLLGLGSSHRQSCPSRSVAGTSPASADSTDCTEPVTRPARPLLYSAASRLSNLAAMSVLSPLSDVRDVMSGVSPCDLTLSLPYSFRSKDGLSSLARSGSLVPSVPSLTGVSPRLVL